MKSTVIELGITCSVKIKNNDYFNFLFLLCKRHPNYDEKFQKFIDFKVYNNIQSKEGPKLKIVNNDDTFTEISWRICVSGQYNTNKRLFSEALRECISIQIKDFKSKNDLSYCRECNCSLTEKILHIDHHEPQFKQLIEDFVELNKEIIYIPTEYDKKEITFRKLFIEKDRWIGELFEKYHLENATFRVLCETCNMTREKYKSKSKLPINTEPLIKTSNKNNLTTLQIPYIECEKVDECIKEEKEKQKIQEIYNLEKKLKSWDASKNEKYKKSKIRIQIKKLNEELSLYTTKKEVLVETKEEKLFNSNCNIEKDLIVKNIEYSYQINNGTRIYQIKRPNTNNLIKYSCSSKKIYMNKKWHTYIDLNSLLYGKIYLNTPFNNKDEFKYYDGYWDNEKRLWFIAKNNKNIEVILSKWTEHKI